MKCPMCNGSGKCYEQKIRYQEIETNRTDFTLAKCHKCNGTGEVEMTNEEWFTSLSTEEKARFFDRICYSAWGDINSRFRDMADYTDWVEWLKQPHKE